MKSSRINVSFYQFSDADFEAKANYIFAGISNNPTVFTNPLPVLADVQTAIERYSADLLAAANRGRVEVARKNEARQALETLLQQLGMYVMNVANGNDTVLTLSGYTLRKPNEPRHITAPQIIKVSNGISSGQLQVLVNAEKGVSVYIHQSTTNYQGEETVWETISTPTSKYTYNNLKPGLQYWFRVGIVGARGQYAYSSVATRYAQ